MASPSVCTPAALSSAFLARVELAATVQISIHIAYDFPILLSFSKYRSWRIGRYKKGFDLHKSKPLSLSFDWLY
ncbi:hypothetical protein D048_1321 [Vibrio parahaemolyticus VPTS-2009]|nr:hypothetical protein D048_1321 [Vibrio parahaemolyticus VPTS-2009]